MIDCFNSQLIRCALIAGSADSEVSDEQKKEKVAELKKKEKHLQDQLAQKIEELKKICMKEAVSYSSFSVALQRKNVPFSKLPVRCGSHLQELTGRLPGDYPLATGEKAPHVRRRVGTAFKLDDLFPYDDVSMAGSVM